jgi:hypothetical protein
MKSSMAMLKEQHSKQMQEAGQIMGEVQKVISKRVSTRPKKQEVEIENTEIKESQRNVVQVTRDIETQNSRHYLILFFVCLAIAFLIQNLQTSFCWEDILNLFRDETEINY